MIKELTEFGWPDCWIDTTKVYMVRPILKNEDTDRITGTTSDTHELYINISGHSQGFTVKEDGLDRLKALHAFLVEEMKKRDVA